MIVSDFRRFMVKQYNEEWLSFVGDFAFLYQDVLVETVGLKYRDAAMISFYEGDYENFTQKINRESLFFTPLERSFHSDNILSDYNYEEKRKDDFGPKYWKGIVTRDFASAEKFKKFFDKNNHEAMGEMLGYPKCCTSYFQKHFKVNNDPVWVNKKGDISGHLECNILLHYFGIRMIPHYPCSPSCVESKKIGEKWHLLMKNKNKNLAKKLQEILKTEMTWDSYHGVVQVETPYFLGVSNTFPFLKKKIINWSVKK